MSARDELRVELAGIREVLRELQSKVASLEGKLEYDRRLALELREDVRELQARR